MKSASDKVMGEGPTAGVVLIRELILRADDPGEGAVLQALNRALMDGGTLVIELPEGGGFRIDRAGYVTEFHP